MRGTSSETGPEADRRLVERFLRGREEDVFRRLYRAHTPYLLRLALRLAGGRQAEAEDAVQEAWLRATRSLADFRGASRLRTWLAGFVVNCCREARRRGARPEAAESPARPASPEAVLDLEAAVLALPDGLREVLVLHLIEGHTHEEIGRLLGIAPGTSKSRLFDARAALRRRLGARGVGGGAS